MTRRTTRPLALVALLIVPAACQAAPDDDPAPSERPADTADRVSRPDADTADRVSRPDADVTDPASRPDAHALLPPLEGYITDEVDAGELGESLAHGPVAHMEIRRRLILDERGLTRGVVTVVTFEPDSDGVERYLEHRFGTANRVPVEIGGVDMLRIDAEPHTILAWTDATFAVTFERGQEVDDEWLVDLARTTVAAVHET